MGYEVEGLGFRSDEIVQERRLIVSAPQRSAILRNILESGVERQAIAACGRQLTREDWTRYQLSGFATVSHLRVIVGESRCPCCNHRLTESQELLHSMEARSRRLSMDPVIARLQCQSWTHELRSPGTGDVFIGRAFPGLSVTR
jgi:hypothetical protein